MSALKFVRWCILTFTLVLAIVVLGISAHLIAIRPTDYWRFAALAVAVSSLTILTLPILLVVNTLARHNISSGRLLSEAGWLTIMWILWLSTGANATRAARSHFFAGACSFFTVYGSKTCNEFKVVQAFSYIIFITLLCYTIGLMVLEFSRSESDGSWAGRTHKGGPQTRDLEAPAPPTGVRR
ncbi:hypothetical protein EDB19DRAFT_277967 [Suillus lakei]|nr:hypothetical protein EDB19DRAFT_277967 [Suillus lakei]